MQLDGLLSRFSLRQLLELSASSLLNGTLEIDAPRGAHRIFFVDGACIHATGPSLSGAAAIWPLFELADAPFRLIADAPSPERSIADPLDQIIAQGEAMARRWSAVRRSIPSLDIVPELVTTTSQEHIRIFEEDWPILTCVDGAHSIAEIAARAMLDPLDVCHGLLRLQQRGLLTFRLQPTAPVEQPAPPPPASAPDPIVELPVAPQARFFARLLSAMPPLSPDHPIDSTLQARADRTLTTDDILRLLRT